MSTAVMAPEVVDLISSSPSPDSPRARPDSLCASEPQVPTFGADSRTTQHSTSRLGTTDAISSSYSNFPSSDLGPNLIARELPLEAERSPKRRRLSPLGAIRQRPRASIADWDISPSASSSIGRLRRDTGTKKIGDDIPPDDSDPFASSPLPSAAAIVNCAPPPVIDLSSPQRNSITLNKASVTGIVGSNVSLGSPEPTEARNTTVSGTAEHSSPNPFESSPLPRVKVTKQPDPLIGVAPKSSNPFKSSPPVQKTGKPAANPISTREQPARKLRDYDPISSSAPEPSSAEISAASRSTRGSATVLSIITIEDSDPEADKSSDDELPDIHKIKPIVPRHAAREPMRRALSDTYATNRQTSSRQPASPKPKISVEERTRAREAKQRAQEADKEAKKQEREQQKRVRALEKEKAAALAEVNKIRTDKKVSTREMIVDLPAGLNETLRTQVETILEGLDVQHTMWQSPVPNVVKLRRKIDSRFDDELGYWVPCPQRIVDEDHVIIIMTAAELAKLAQDGLDAYHETVRTQLPTNRQLFILEGVTPWMRKNRNARNRQFASGVRAQSSNHPTATSSQPRRRGNTAPPPEPIPDDTIEDAMLQLQVAHGALIHHTNIPLETAQWIGHFTQHISTAPYRRQRERSTTTAGFCMESGQVRTGDDAADTYVRMLQEVARVTQPVAYGVAAEFGTVTKLVKGLEEGGQGRLEMMRKCANKDGAFSDRTLGKAMSKRLWQVFLGQDETSTDV